MYVQLQQMDATVKPPGETVSYIPFAILLLLAILIAAVLGGIGIIAGNGKNWSEIRCDPMVMPFASLYGHNTAENINYCMTNSFAKQANARMGPVYGMMAGMVGTLGTVVEATQKLRYSTANLYGGVTNIMRDFTERLKLFFIQIKISAQRMKMLMHRVYATFFSVIYMSMSGVTAISNFTGTALFGILDTFCFDPHTLVDISGRGMVPIRAVSLGDTFRETGGVITAHFEFLADGQPMVSLPGVAAVSTNHYVAHGESWIKAGDHPAASHIGYWNGGTARPIVCLNTSDHTIPVAGYMFRDYDETEAGHRDALEFAHRSVNGVSVPFTTAYGVRWNELYPSVAPDVQIRLHDGTCKPAAKLQLGERLSQGDTVHGIIRMVVSEYVVLPAPAGGEAAVGAGTLVWDARDCKWVRAGDVYSVVRSPSKRIFYGFITLPGSKLELESGHFVRDYFEVASPDMETSYTTALKSTPVPNRAIMVNAE